MARITVEDCLKKIDSQYDLVLLAKERTFQLNAGEQPLVPDNNDKNTVIALREIGEGKVSIKELEESAINKLRKQQENLAATGELEDDEYEDSFDKIYKGEVSKSGTAVLPSKRIRRVAEKSNIDKNISDYKKENKDKENLEEQQKEKEPLLADKESGQ